VNYPTEHRQPFALIDRVVQVDLGKWAQALKNITMNDKVFMGHFPNRPIFPGVFIVEALSQVAQLVAGPGVGITAKLDKFRFLRPVYPGDQLLLHVDFVNQVGPVTLMKGKASVAGVKVCTGEITGYSTSENEIGG
jgi:3-hydroxyacyl-[acyl-carrier-protein] dehydratase